MGNQLSEKQRIEKDYHNRRYRCEHNASAFNNSAISSYKFYWNLIGEVNGLKILDFGCGNGWLSILLANRGAKMWGIDISEELIKKATEWAKKEGLTEKVGFREMAAEDLDFKNDFFDLILGSAILHHTDTKLAVENIYRVLKKGGRAIFVEPMNQNIFLRIWRNLTPWRRSPAEKALTYKELKCIQNIFPDARYYFFSVTAIFTQGLLLFSPKNKLLLFINDLLERFDGFCLRVFPLLGRYSAVVVMELVKGTKD